MRAAAATVGTGLQAQSRRYLRGRGRGGAEDRPGAGTRLSAAEQRDVAGVPTRDPDALDAYLRGKHDVDQAADDVTYTTLLPKAIRNFQRAVKLDQAMPGLGRPGGHPDRAFPGGQQLRMNLCRKPRPMSGARCSGPATSRGALRHGPSPRVRPRGHESGSLAIPQGDRATPSYAEPCAWGLDPNSSTRATWSTVSRNSSMPSLSDPNSADYASELAPGALIRGNFEASRRMSRRTIALAPERHPGLRAVERCDILPDG